MEPNQSSISSQAVIKIVLLSVIMLLLGGIIGITFQTVIFPKEVKKTANTQPQQNANTKDFALYNPSNILVNRVFTEWLGSVEGKVVEKTADSFTLERNNDRLVIYLQKSLTLFMGDEISPGKRQKLTFDQIPVGTLLRGGVTISRGSLTGKSDQHVVANGFTVIKELGK